jgi:hypothetical protein
MSQNYSSGWCERCGRRRGGDGRCSNCDPWWTSPLLQVGAPLVAGCAAVLVFLISTYGTRPSERLGARETRPMSAPMPSAPSVLMPGGPAGSVASILPYAPTAPFVANPAPTFASPRSIDRSQGWSSAPLQETPSPEAMCWAELEQLRSMVWAADAAERQSSPSGGGYVAPRESYTAVGGPISAPGI